MTRTRIIIGGIVVLAIVAAIFAIRHSGEKAGEAKVTTKIERQHAELVGEARADERQAAAVADSISRRVDRADTLSTAAVQATIKDLRDALDAVPPAPAGAPVPAAPVESRLRSAFRFLDNRRSGARLDGLLVGRKDRPLRLALCKRRFRR